MKKQKGFTLIELLAVIVILAVIALIATPMILGVIESSKKGAAEASAYRYMEALEQYQVLHSTFPSSIQAINELVSIKGTKPSKGSFEFSKEGTIQRANLCINGYYVIYDGKKASVDPTKSCDLIAEDPNAPKLLQSMIPVVYENGTWVKADLTSWYQYSQQKWANAVTVTESSRAFYLSAEVGTMIPMDDINLMLVWIPRYAYRIDGTYGTREDGSSGTAEAPGPISIQFLSGTSQVVSDGYRVHPAFTFGGTELTGFWVGKFETSATNLSNTSADDEEKSILVKPNVVSWRNHRIATAFASIRKMELSGNPYGFPQTGTKYNEDGSITGDSNSMDSHMMKNTEWGAVAYLSQSSYGKYGNLNYEGANKEIYRNNNSNYLTGCSSGSPTGVSSSSCEHSYEENVSGTGASTTGTIYGVYDMSGGAWEYVMGSYNQMSGYTAIEYTASQAASILNRNDGLPVGILNSGFNGPVYGKALDGVTSLNYSSGVSFPQEKYYNLYTTDQKTTACNGGSCFGDGVSETAGWYRDDPYFIWAGSPWLIRGGAQHNKSNGVGIFAYSNGNGSIEASSGNRVVVTIE